MVNRKMGTYITDSILLNNDNYLECAINIERDNLKISSYRHFSKVNFYHFSMWAVKKLLLLLEHAVDTCCKARLIYLVVFQLYANAFKDILILRIPSKRIICSDEDTLFFALVQLRGVCLAF